MSKKGILTDKESGMEDTLNICLKSNDSSSNENSGKIDGEIPDLSDFIKKMSYDNPNFVKDVLDNIRKNELEQ